VQAISKNCNSILKALYVTQIKFKGAGFIGDDWTKEEKFHL
jgi:predicted nucleic acid-binding Zn ribbon protein